MFGRLGATGMLRRIAIATGFLFAAVAVANAMDFTLRDNLTVRASGPIEGGDAAKFAALPKFDALELDSPGGLVGESLRMAANMDARGGIRTVVKPGASCASACAMVRQQADIAVAGLAPVTFRRCGADTLGRYGRAP